MRFLWNVYWIRSSHFSWPERKRLVVTHKLADGDDEGRFESLSAEGGSGPAFTPGEMDALTIPYFYRARRLWRRARKKSGGKQ
jgi:hypothetical protein